MQDLRQLAVPRQHYTVVRKSALTNIINSRVMSLRPVDIFQHFLYPHFLHVSFPYLTEDELSFLRNGYTSDELAKYLDWMCDI